MTSKTAFMQPFQGSGIRNDVPRVALRLPWADGFNPFGVKTAEPFTRADGGPPLSSMPLNETAAR